MGMEIAKHLGAILLADALQRAFESASTPDSLRLVLPMRLAGGRTER